MNREELLKIQVGDYVGNIILGNPKLELIKTIEHQTHGIRSNPENSCCINGYYWYYDDIRVWFDSKTEEFKINNIK